jgi:hypothetical protein
MTNLVNKAKLVTALDQLGADFNGLAPLAQVLADQGRPSSLKVLEATGQVLSALVKGLEAGNFDASSSDVHADYANEDLDTDDEDEERVKFGAFVTTTRGGARSINIPGDFDTRSEAWDAIQAFVEDENSGMCVTDYEVRPLD